MKRRKTGHYETTSTAGETVRAFIPLALPPHPPLEWDESLRLIHEHALIELGRLDGACSILPEPLLFLYSYVRKEALLSSQIEGTQSSLADLFVFEAGEQPTVTVDDVEEVSNYVAAMDHGLDRLRNNFPLSSRLLREVHSRLLAGGRGSTKRPGEFRKSQNWIGGTRPGNAHFVPPPPQAVSDCMRDLENFIHGKPESYPTLIKAALAHVQFETIHPFLDGNGRVGRLLITLILSSEGLIQMPLLYLSLYFKENRDEYYRLLDLVRTEGNWEAWLSFFLTGVKETAAEGNRAAQSLLQLFTNDRNRIQELGRVGPSVHAVHYELQRGPIGTVKRLCKKTKLTPATVNKALEKLTQLGIVSEMTGQQRNRLFVYTKMLRILSEGTKPI